VPVDARYRAGWAVWPPSRPDKTALVAACSLPRRRLQVIASFLIVIKSILYCRLLVSDGPCLLYEHVFWIAYPQITVLLR